MFDSPTLTTPERLKACILGVVDSLSNLPSFLCQVVFPDGSPSESMTCELGYLGSSPVLCGRVPFTGRQFHDSGLADSFTLQVEDARFTIRPFASPEGAVLVNGGTMIFTFVA